MKRTTGTLVVGALIAWAVPAAADVANDDCGTKELGDACETFSGDTGVCTEDDEDALFCNTTSEPAPDGGGTGGSAGPKDDDDDGCTVRNAGAGGKGEAAALGLLLLTCIALRKRFD